MEGVGASQLTVKPDGTGLGLAELRAISLGQQRCGQSMRPHLIGPTKQFNSRSDIPPLVRTAMLQGDSVPTVQLPVVHRLEKYVGELRVADPRI